MFWPWDSDSTFGKFLHHSEYLATTFRMMMSALHNQLDVGLSLCSIVYSTLKTVKICQPLQRQNHDYVFHQHQLPWIFHVPTNWECIAENRKVSIWSLRAQWWIRFRRVTIDVRLFRAIAGDILMRFFSSQQVLRYENYVAGETPKDVNHEDSVWWSDRGLYLTM